MSFLPLEAYEAVSAWIRTGLKDYGVAKDGGSRHHRHHAWMGRQRAWMCGILRAEGNRAKRRRNTATWVAVGRVAGHLPYSCLLEAVPS